MIRQSNTTDVIDARGRVGESTRGEQKRSASDIDRAAHLRAWRPLPREAADVICGEGAVGALPIHTHEALQVLLPASRFAVIDGRGDAVVVRPGQVHIAAPMELHGVQSIDGPCELRVILVSPAAVPGLVGELAGLWCGATPGRQQFVLDAPDLYAELWALVGDMRGPAVALSCVPRLLGSLTRLLAALATRPTPTQRPRTGRQVVGVGRVCEYLRANIAQNVSLDELASVAGLSKFYLLRAFRRAHGVTPHAYQMQLRIAHAWRFIVEGRPLSSATYDAGFADQSHLTRRFAALFGLAPARYARQLALPPGTSPRDAFDLRASSASPSAA